MGAIAGIIYLDGRSVEERDLRQMIDSQPGRSRPSTIVRGSCGFAQKSPSENTFFCDQEHGSIITASARLDNPRELASSLGLFGELSDGELILRAYQKWGEDCLAHFSGDFGFAIWHDKQLFCARDHLGVQPFVYSYSAGKHFVFASEVRALRALEGFSWTKNRARIADFILGDNFEGFDSTSTFIEEINRLPPATSLRLSAKSLSTSSYWDIKSQEAGAEAFLELFEKAVSRRLRSPTEVGLLLSGGLDSTSIYAVAEKQLSNKELRCFSGVDDNLDSCQEYKNIRLLSSSTLLSPKESLSYREEFLAFALNTDELFDTQNTAMQFALYSMAKQAGVAVVLDGVDGDLVTSSNPYALADLLRELSVNELVKEARGYSRYYGVPIWKMIIQFGLLPLCPDLHLSLGKRMPPKYSGSRLLSPDLALQIHLGDRINTLIERTRASNAREVQENGVRSPVIAAALERYSRLAGAHGLEARHPFLDKELVEFCLSLSSKEKFYRGEEKRILRRFMKDLLPEQIRKQVSHNTHMATTFQMAIADIEPMEQSITQAADELGEYVDAEYLREVFERYHQKQTEEDFDLIWRAYILSVWLPKWSNTKEKTSDKMLSVNPL